MKYYVVSEEELENLYEVGWSAGYDAGEERSIDDVETLTKVHADCRARPVQLKSIFRNGVGGGSKLWEEITND